MPSSNASDRSVELRTAALVLWSLAAVATALRIYVRTRIMKAFTIDDWFMMLAMASYTANTTTSVLGTYYGSGRHMTDLVITDAMRAMMYWWACYPTFAITMVASKFSVAFFLLRITTQKVHRWIIYSAMSVSLASSLAFFFVAIFQCSPVEFAWTRFVSTAGTCLALDTIIKVTITYSTFAIITDFTFTLLPAWLVLNLQMDKRTKLAIIPILSMACIASCAVAVRLAFLNDFTNPDFLWATVDIAIWSQTEQGLAIAAGSFATLRPLFRKMVHALGLTTTSGATHGPTYGNGNGQSALPSRGAVGAGYRFKSTSTFGSSSTRDKQHSMFSMTTFQRIDDEHDDVEKGANLSTSELNSPVSDRGDRRGGGRMERIVDEEAQQQQEYRVKISNNNNSVPHALPMYPPGITGTSVPRKDFADEYSPTTSARTREGF